MDEQYPKASKVIAAIQALIDKHGDLPLVVRDPDTGYQLDVGVVHRLPNEHYTVDTAFECIEITSNYGKPEGLIEP